MKHVSKLVSLSLLIPSIFLLSGCGTTPTGTGVTVTETSGTTTTTTTGTIKEESNVFVFIRDSGFSPEILNIKVGTKITWKNRDSVSHTVSADGIFTSEALAKNGEYSYTFDKIGTYSYICSSHPNMKGSIVVTE